MPGGDLATRFPERMLYGILPDDRVRSLLASRGWPDVELGVLAKQVASGFNVTQTTSTGRVLDAAAALLGICRERTYDGEPAMKLESAAASGKAELWPLVFGTRDGCETLSSRALLETALDNVQAVPDGNRQIICNLAASFQYNLARGIAELAARAAVRDGMTEIALSGGVAYNHAIRTTIERELAARGLTCITNREYPLGDGCVSYGQCVYAGRLLAKGD
jgi:hydrogenase maturation protein HypF